MAGTRVCHICGNAISGRGCGTDVRFRWPFLFHVCPQCVRKRVDLSARAWRCTSRVKLLVAAVLYASAIALASVPFSSVAEWMVKTFEPTKPLYHPAREPFTRTMVVDGKEQEMTIVGWTQYGYDVVELHGRMWKYELAIPCVAACLMFAAIVLGKRAWAQGRRRAMAAMEGVSVGTS